ncbi:protein of unknown function (plasmid) [Azospirillum baldaniorum]|uniref:Uncharacterized protein n=1 Tax=Azospirillum baldaniorum TaxID=1064539 RepID=A0A9P1NRV7_9PROT|nr:protein of unknown function [Azospirillum baldaniorum]
MRAMHAPGRSGEPTGPEAAFPSPTSKASGGFMLLWIDARPKRTLSRKPERIGCDTSA